MAQRGRQKGMNKQYAGGLMWKGSCVIVGLDIIVLLLGTFTKFPLSAAVGGVGIITFFGMLILANLLSEDPALEKGEMRKSIAASFTAVYFALVSLLTFKGTSSTNTELSKTIIAHFTYLMGIVVVFYFASSAVRDYLKTKA